MLQKFEWKSSNRPLPTFKDKAHSSPSATLMAGNSLSSSSTPPLHQPVSLLTPSQIKPTLVIPEILLAIAAFLSRHFLAQCALVCKEWNAVFQPLLFRVVLATDFDHPNFLHAFQNYSRFVTSIECVQGSSTSLPAASNAWRRFCHRVALSSSYSSSMSSSSRPFAILSRRPFEQLQNSLLPGQTPLLESLFVQIQNQDPNCILRLSASTVSNLWINTGGYLAKRARLYMEDTLRSYPNLIHLTLEGRFTLSSRLFEEQGFDNTPRLDVKGKAVDRSFSLESLHLRLVGISQEELLALSVLLPRLKSLLFEESLTPNIMVKTYHWKWSSSFVQLLRTAFPHLQSLRFAFLFDSIKEDTIIEILRSFPRLTTVGFRNAHFGKRAMETLREYCKFVECLEVSFARSCSEEFRTQFKAELLRSFRAWSGLRELVVSEIIFYLDVPIDAGVIRAPWACIQLEKLVCGFHGPESMIFQFISQFPMLTHLTITQPPLNISCIDTTLAWMSRSTKIEYLSFEQHRKYPLKRETFQWLLNHLPNLKKVHVAGTVSEHQ
ncbi:hypothetical protein BGZ98_004145, partial [Dissophora globulifera]